MGMSSSQMIQQRYSKKKVVWFDKGDSYQQYQKLHRQFNLIKITKIDEMIRYLQMFSEIDRFAVVCQGSLSKQLLAEIDKRPKLKITVLFIFCLDMKKYEDRLQNKRVKAIIIDQQQLIQEIHKSIDHPSTIPIIRTLDEKQDVPKYLQYSYDLQSTINQTDFNQTARINQANKLSTTLSTYVNIPNDNIVYPTTINHEAIFNIYSTDRVYQYITNILSTQGLAHLKNIELYISDLFHAIKKTSSFEHRSNIQESVFYSGGYYAKQDILRFKLLVGQDVQFLGFLQALKSQSEAKKQTKNVFFTIYIPEFFKKKQYSAFQLQKGYIKLQKRDIIVFNIKSIMRFLRFYQQNNIYYCQFIYGLNEILLYTQRSSKMIKIHDTKRSQFPAKCTCIPRHHLINPVNKTINCLINAKKKDFIKQSFVIVNINSREIQGINIEYSPDVQYKMMQIYEKIQSKCCNIIKCCKSCLTIVKCSDCIDTFCLCNIKEHSSSHLASSIILIEGMIPRIISISNETTIITISSFYKKSMSQATNISQQLMTYPPSSVIDPYEDSVKDSQKIEQFDKLDTKAQSQHYLQKVKHFYQSNAQISSDSFQESLKDLEQCINLSTNQKDYDLLAQAYLYMGMIHNRLRSAQKAVNNLQKARKAIKQLQIQKEKLSSSQIKIKNLILQKIAEYKSKIQVSQQFSEPFSLLQCNISQIDNKNNNNNSNSNKSKIQMKMPYQSQELLSSQSILNLIQNSQYQDS